MSKDYRYDTVNFLIESGKINSIRDIFLHIPKTIVYKDLGINFGRFDRAIIDPSIFRLEELANLAELIGVNAKKLIDMAYEQMITVAKKKRNKNATKLIQRRHLWKNNNTHGL